LRFAVLGDVRQRLLDDPEDRHFHRRWQSTVVQAFKRRDYPMLGGELPNEPP